MGSGFLDLQISDSYVEMLAMIFFLILAADAVVDGMMVSTVIDDCEEQNDK